ncbi:MAG: flagellin, partial [Lachnospiraceae bacterium]|nr:flagellin [Lachnospiraceae bacterium]
MKINHNISAVITNKQLLRTEDTLAKSMERLSSGLSINHAKDNPSGMAISGKMKAQIDGLGQASTNSSDGISVIETADGALNEVSSIIQRMRELSVQAANDTNAQSEKEAIQTEISSLKEEIDRISSTTEFNTKTLLDGSLDTRIYGNNVSRMTSTEYVSAGTYKFSVD